MALPRPFVPLAGPLVLLPLLLSACGGTPFGDALSRSFSRAPAATASSAAAASSGAPPSPGAPGTPASSRPTSPVQATPAPAVRKPAINATPAGTAASATSEPAPAAAMRPAPYRVTIRLPQADPSAPAEVVTRALRAAGVPFEVETIERMPGAAAVTGESPAAATGSVAPAPPSSRPAPAPR